MECYIIEIKHNINISKNKMDNYKIIKNIIN